MMLRIVFLNTDEPMNFTVLTDAEKAFLGFADGIEGKNIDVDLQTCLSQSENVLTDIKSALDELKEKSLSGFISAMEDLKNAMSDAKTSLADCKTDKTDVQQLVTDMDTIKAN